MFAPNTRFLVVDDFAMMRKIVKKILIDDLGYKNFQEGFNGKHAWELLLDQHSKGTPFDVVISDWNMPELMGVELLKKCRSHDHYKKIPFMLVTAESELSQIKEALSLGVSEYVLKPFTPAILKQKLENAYNKHNNNSTTKVG